MNDHTPGATAKPTSERRGFVELFHSPAMAWAILLVSTLLTGFGWWVSRSYVEQRAQERFSYEVDRAEQLILRQMRVFERMVIGARGLHYASTGVTREDWRTYVASLKLPEYYSGVQAMGFVRWVPGSEKSAYEARVRAEGFPQFAVTPPGERDGYACVTYIEPFEARNLRAFGYDLWSEPVRQAGLSLARDTGKPALTGKMYLVQETGTNVQPGVIMLVPMYRSGQPTGTVAERRAALFGWVHAPFRVGDLMQGILGNANPEIGFDLFDGTQVTQVAHLFDSDADLGAPPASYTPSRTETRTIEVAGHPWTLRFHTRPEFEAATASNQPFLIAFGGLAIDGLLFAIIWSLSGLRRRAERMAEVMTVNYRRANGALEEKMAERENAEAEARASEVRYRTLIERMGEGLILVDAEEIIRFVNPQICQMLGYTAAEMLGQNASELLLSGDADRAAMAERNRKRAQGVSEGYEVRLRKKSGAMLIAWNSATPVTTADGRPAGSMAIITDITERKLAEGAQTASHERALRQRTAIAGMVFDEAMNADDSQRALRRLTEEVAAALQVDRASVWLNSEEVHGMRCIDLFQAAAQKHSEGAIIPSAICPRYWHALQTESRINADDAVTDPRTSEFAESYLIPLGITSMLDAVIQMEGKPRGVLCIEHTGAARHWEPDEESFANTAASLVAQILANVERQRAESRLRESEQRLDRVVKNINDMLIVDDLDGRIVYANQKFFQVFGITEQMLDGMRIEDYVAPEWRARQRELHDRRVRGERVPDHFECEGLRRDGTRVWLEVSVVLIGEGGRTVGTQSVFRDITERKRSEARIAAFAELGQKLSAAETARAASEIIVGLADRLLGWDSCVVNLYSAADDSLESVLRKDLMGGERVDVLVPTTDRSVTPRARRVLTRGGELTLREPAEGMPADAVPFGDLARPSMSLLTVPIRDRDRSIAILSIQSYQVHAYTADDLDLLQALADHCGGALARIQATQELRISQERFRLVWENAVDGMRLTDIEGRVVAANAAFCRLMGRPREEVVGRLFSEFYAEPERVRILARHRERFTQHTVPSLMERRLPLWDGRVVWLAVSNCFLETDPARPLLLAIMRDITPNRNLEEQLRQSQKMEAVGQLAGGIAHDFNNILGAIIGNVELARLMEPGDPELAVSHEAIFQASQRASALVRQILTFSRRQEQQRQPTQLQSVTREAVNLLRATVPASVVFEKDLPTVPVVLADPSEIHQVTMNLCTNAWHALQGQPGTIRVALAEAMVDEDFAEQHPELRPGRYVRFTVADSGCGMDANTLAHIFEPFFTTKSVGTGTGLGLAVVHGIMKNHDGGIVVTSAPGKGTTFDLYFPALESQDVAPAAEVVPIQPGNGEHILFVDDEEPLVKMGRNTLTRLGYRVTACTSPGEALAIFREQSAQFDLVITDYNMPGMNGTAFGAQLLAVRSDMRIIITTGFSTIVTEENARALGFRELLPKPYVMSSLGESVARVLTGQELPVSAP